MLEFHQNLGRPIYTAFQYYRNCRQPLMKLAADMREYPLPPEAQKIYYRDFVPIYQKARRIQVPIVLDYHTAADIYQQIRNLWLLEKYK